jgi:glutamate carboxypeptidase
MISLIKIIRHFISMAPILTCAVLFAGQATAQSPNQGESRIEPSQKSAGRSSQEWIAAERQQDSFLETLQQLVTIESGSRDLEGLEQLAALIGRQLTTLGMNVQIEASRAPDFHPLLKGAALGPTVLGRKLGRGSRKILLIAHMDTVYPKGSAKQQPFRVEGERVYGLGIADDKAGVALILHTVELLQRLGFDNYAELAVFINGDEEIGSPGSGQKLVELGSQYDAVFSFEGGGGRTDWVRLATSSIAIAELKVTGRSSHAGSNPEGGRNAIYELAHQILKTRNLGDPLKGLKINWTVVEGGGVRNVIPAQASAIADIRSLTNEDLDLMERALRAAIEERLIPDTKIELIFYRSRPAFVPNDISIKLARHAQSIFQEIGLALEIRDRATGGGTDAAFAGQRPKGGVLESFGLRGFGAHSNDREYIMIDSVVPRLYLATRMVMDVGSLKITW